MTDDPNRPCDPDPSDPARPKGAEPGPEEDEPTERQTERAIEDRRYLPVIVKRIDEATRHPDDVLEFAIEEGIEQTRRGSLSLLLSAVAAGAILAFTALAVGVMSAITADVEPFVVQRLYLAIVYPLGFIMVLMSGTQLFTEHTALAVYPVLDRKCKMIEMLRVWAVVLAGNLLGCLLGALLLWGAGSVIEADAGFLAVASHTVDHPPLDILMSAVLAGWLMALGGWLILATPPDFSQIAMIYFVTFLIGLGGLHHSIAGTSEILIAAFIGAEFTAGQAISMIGLAVIGNLAGGSLFVAVLNYGYIRQTAVSIGEAEHEKPSD